MCGVIGVQSIGGLEGQNQDEFLLSDYVARGLHALQHRGQDACGIISFKKSKNKFYTRKKMGPVSSLFEDSTNDNIESDVMIGHNRYVTVSRNCIEDVQPFLSSYPYGLAIAHNGNISNYFDLYDESESPKISSNDAEIILNQLNIDLGSRSYKLKTIDATDLFKAVSKVMEVTVGSYSVVGILSSIGMFAFRDPLGIRPLSFGKKIDPLTGREVYAFVSEDKALNAMGLEKIRDVGPGECVLVDFNGKITWKKIIVNDFPKHCMFEWVYFASPDTILENSAVYDVRIELGVILAKKIKKLIDLKKIPTPDLITSVPETSRIPAIALSKELDIPYEEVIIKSIYSPRSFITGGNSARKKIIQDKLTPIKHRIQNKNVLIIDDSIVRGNTILNISEKILKCNTKNITIGSICPKIIHPCFYGVDFNSYDQLIAHNKNDEQIADYLKVDNVIYNDIEGLNEVLEKGLTCRACLDGFYPTSTKHFDSFVEKRQEVYI